MDADAWDAATRLGYDHLPPAGASDRRLRLFAVACSRQWADLWLTDHLPAVVDAAERFADAAVPEAEFRAVVTRAAAADWSARPQGGEDAASVVSHAAARTGLPHARWAALCQDRLVLPAGDADRAAAYDRTKTRLVRCLFGNPFRPVAFAPRWRTDTAVALAAHAYASRDFSALPVLADALQDAGCDSDAVLAHCRGDGPHARGCWVVDLVLGKE